MTDREGILRMQPSGRWAVCRPGRIPLAHQVTVHQDWEEETKRYQLTDHGGGTFSYVLKNGMEQGDPGHARTQKRQSASFRRGRGFILQAWPRLAALQNQQLLPEAKIICDRQAGLRLGRLEPRDGTVEVTTDGDTT